MSELAARILPPGSETHWIVGPSATAAGLPGELHVIADPGPRDWRGVAAGFAPALRILRSVRPTAVVSTGAAIALPVFSAARVLGLESHYIESAARIEGPSFTGTLLGSVPGVFRYSQWTWRGSRQWQNVGSVFDGFAPEESARRKDVPKRVVVTLGTQQRYGFRRLIERLLELFANVLPPDSEILWQVGSTDTSGLPIAAHDILPPDRFRSALERADLVVAHAGVGSALGALTAGKVPVLVPRTRAEGEHVDDHQRLLGDALELRGLAIVRELSNLTENDLLAAAAARAAKVTCPPMALGGRLGAILGQRQTSPVPPADSLSR